MSCPRRTSIKFRPKIEPWFQREQQPTHLLLYESIPLCCLCLMIGLTC